MINEAVFVLQERPASAEEIDAGMKPSCNHPIGLLALADLIGLDTTLSVMRVFQLLSELLCQAQAKALPIHGRDNLPVPYRDCAAHLLDRLGDLRLVLLSRCATTKCWRAPPKSRFSP